MGVAQSTWDSISSLQRETKDFARWSLEDVRALYNRFQKTIFGFALVETEFEAILGDKKPVDVPIPQLFKALDNDFDGRIDGLEFIGGLVICCRGSFEEKARFCFELFDFNLNGSLSPAEMTMMLQSSLCGMLVLTGGGADLEPPLERFEELTEEAFSNADSDGSLAVNYEEFVVWARQNREMMRAMERLRDVSVSAAQEVESEEEAEELGWDESDVEGEGRFEQRTPLQACMLQDLPWTPPSAGSDMTPSGGGGGVAPPLACWSGGAVSMEQGKGPAGVGSGGA